MRSFRYHAIKNLALTESSFSNPTILGMLEEPALAMMGFKSGVMYDRGVSSWCGEGIAPMGRGSPPDSMLDLARGTFLNQHVENI